MRSLVKRLVVFGFAWSVAPLAAQTPSDFTNLRAKVGDTVYITDASTGTRVIGTLSGLSPDELSVDGYRFRPVPGLKVERAGDPVWDGAAVGFVLGAALIFPLIPETFVPRGGHIRINNGMFWGFGALIDHQYNGRRTIFDRSLETRARTKVEIVPALDRHHKVLRVAISR